MKAAATATESVVALAPERRLATRAGGETSTPASARGGFRLLRYFSIASLIAIVLAVAGLGLFFRQTALKQLVKVGEESNVALATALAHALAPRYMPLMEPTDADSARLRAQREVPALHDAVLNVVPGTSIVKVRIHDASGRTLYSSDRRQIGADQSADPGFVAARAGTIRTVAHHVDTLDAFGRALADRHLVVSHVPVRRPGAEKILAVFELHSDVTPFFDEIRRTQVHLRLGAAAVMILLYAALFFIVRRADAVIRGQEAQRRLDEETIRHLAHHDPLTGLPNRQLFNERLQFTVARARRSGHMAALMFVDLDRFKHINDTLGHAVGDRVLQAAGTLLRGSLRDVDTVARLGGDEFTIILEDVASIDQVRTVAEKIEAAFANAALAENGLDIRVTPSIGIALYPRDAHDVEGLLHAADAAMYEAKAAGRNTYAFSRSGALAR